MKKNIRLKLTSLLIALATMFSFVSSTPVFAADTSAFEDPMVRVDEAKELRQKLDEALNETSLTRESYKTDYWGYCTVTNTHTGGNHTIYGHQARLCVAFKPLDGNLALSVYLSSFINVDTFYHYNTVDSDGYYMYVSDWTSVNYMGAYNIFYKIWTSGNGGTPDGRRAHFHVWVDYK